MKGFLAVCVLLCAAVCSLGAPTRPSISQQYYSEVHVYINDNGRHLTGGGIWAYDIPNNMGRMDFKLENSSNLIETIHILERFDLHEVYEIFDDGQCKTTPVSGSIQSPLDWVAKSEFIGTTTYRGRSHDIWGLTVTEKGGVFTNRLYVDSENVNIPVYYTSINNGSSPANYGMNVEFLSWNPKEPHSWVFHIPTTCNSSLEGHQYGGCNSQAVVYFANSNWNCGNVACTYRVPDGSSQPGYACAEFTARSLAAGGYVGLSTTAPQSSYGNYRGYNLLYVSSLSSYCGASGFSARSPTASSVQAAYPIMGNGGDGAWSHACIGVGPGLDDCHNIARENHAASGSFYAGIQAVWAPPGC